MTQTSSTCLACTHLNTDGFPIGPRHGTYHIATNAFLSLHIKTHHGRGGSGPCHRTNKRAPQQRCIANGAGRTPIATGENKSLPRRPIRIRSRCRRLWDYPTALSTKERIKHPPCGFCPAAFELCLIPLIVVTSTMYPAFVPSCYPCCTVV